MFCERRSRPLAKNFDKYFYPLPNRFPGTSIEAGDSHFWEFEWVRRTKKNISLEMECIDSTSKMIGTALLMHGWWLLRLTGEWVLGHFFPMICMDKNLYYLAPIRSSYIFEVIVIILYHCWGGKYIPPEAGSDFYDIYTYICNTSIFLFQYRL